MKELKRKKADQVHRHDKKSFLPGLIIFFTALLLYSNTVWNEYALDDIAVINQNKYTLKGVAGLPDIFTTSYWHGFNRSTDLGYRPLSVATFAVEHSISPENPHLSHAVQVLLFGTCCWLAFVFLSLCFFGKSLFIPFATALLFTVHPIHTEVVANLKSRDEVLSLLFILLTSVYLLRYLHSGKIKKLYFAAGAYFLSLLSKENSATYLAIAPAIAWFFSEHSLKRAGRIALFFGAVFAFYMLVRVLLLDTLSVRMGMPVMDNTLVAATDPIKRFASAVSILGRYLLLLIFPHPLSNDYSFAQIPIVGPGHWSFILSFPVYLSAIVFAVKRFSKRDPAAFGIIFYLTSFALTCNIFFLVGATLAERFLFTPSLGFFLTVVVLADRYLIKTANAESIKNVAASNKLFSVIFITILGLYSVKTVARNFDWKNNYTLFSRDLKACPKSARIHYYYGTTLIERYMKNEEQKPLKQAALLTDGIRSLNKALSIYPHFTEAIAEMALAYYYKKDYPRAIGYYKKALLHDSTNANTYNNYGNALMEAGRYTESIAALRRAIALDPEKFDSHNNLGQAFVKAGEYEKALLATRRSIELNPSWVTSYVNLANIYVRMKQYDKALEIFNDALKLNKDQAGIYYYMGFVYQKKGDKERADYYMEASKKLDPHVAEHFEQ